MKIQQFNALATASKKAELLTCCTSDNWAEQLSEAGPFQSTEHLKQIADIIWHRLDEADYLQAFDGHPQIGDVNTLKAKYANTKSLASGEQSGVDQASDAIIESLAHYNKLYLDKFGFIFIVCATGKSAAEMLELLKHRVVNTRPQEISNAAEEQRKITAIRIDKLITDSANAA